jgi:hypothetical protein
MIECASTEACPLLIWSVRRIGGRLKNESVGSLVLTHLESWEGSWMAIWLRWKLIAREIYRRKWKTFMKLSLILTDAYDLVRQFI